jgi:hypothetical protein
MDLFIDHMDKKSMDMVIMDQEIHLDYEKIRANRQDIL